MEKVKLKFYSIDKCGYYKYNSDDAHLTNVADVLEDLKDWIKDKTLQQTQTTGILSAISERLPIYCVNVTKSTLHNTYLLVTWNKSESVGGNISSIHKDELVNRVASNVTSTGLPTDHIPGYATYFWFIPEDNILATVRFNHASNGHIGMNYYLKGFLSRFSKYVNKVEDKENKGHFEVEGYCRKGDKTDESLHPYFNSTLKKLSGKVDYIKSKTGSITKVIRKATISHEVSDENSLLDSFFQHLGIEEAPVNEPLEIKYEMKTELNHQQLDDIIDSWTNSHEEHWDDIGFKVKNEDSPLWLKADVPSDEIDLNVVRNNDEFIDFDKFIIDLESRLELFKRIYTEG